MRLKSDEIYSNKFKIIYRSAYVEEKNMLLLKKTKYQA